MRIPGNPRAPSVRLLFIPGAVALGTRNFGWIWIDDAHERERAGMMLALGVGGVGIFGDFLCRVVAVEAAPPAPTLIGPVVKIELEQVSMAELGPSSGAMN